MNRLFFRSRTFAIASLAALWGVGIALAVASPASAQSRQSAAAAARDAKPNFVIGTGSKDKVYNKAGNLLVKFLNPTVTAAAAITGGSVDNLDRLIAGTVDGAFVQNDVLRTYGDARALAVVVRTASVYKEYLHLLCNRASGITALSQLTEKHTIAAGSPRSGTRQTWQTFVDANAKYAKVQVSTSDDVVALTSAADGTEVTCALIVAGMNAPVIAKDARGLADKIVLATIDDDKLTSLKDTKGRPVYEEATISAKAYPALAPRGWFSGKDIQTISVDAVFVTSQNWIDANTGHYSDVVRAVNGARPGILDLATPALR